MVVSSWVYLARAPIVAEPPMSLLSFPTFFYLVDGDVSDGPSDGEFIVGKSVHFWGHA